jgi:hypothetical protein
MKSLSTEDGDHARDVSHHGVIRTVQTSKRCAIVNDVAADIAFESIHFQGRRDRCCNRKTLVLLQKGSNGVDSRVVGHRAQVR